MMLFAAICAIFAILVIGFGIYTTSKGYKNKAERTNMIIQTAALAVALLIPGYQSWQSDKDKADQSREAISRMLTTTYAPQGVDDAFGSLNQYERNPNLGLVGQKDFDDRTGTLISYFWAVNLCIRADICERKLGMEVFCEDYVRYRNVYGRVHGLPEKQRRFGFMDVLEKCPSR